MQKKVWFHQSKTMDVKQGPGAPQEATVNIQRCKITVNIIQFNQNAKQKKVLLTSCVSVY